MKFPTKNSGSSQFVMLVSIAVYMISIDFRMEKMLDLYRLIIQALTNINMNGVEHRRKKPQTSQILSGTRGMVLAGEV